MYDCHCHLLPEIDDGASNLEEALALARHAVTAGITHSIVTPHQHYGRYDNQAHNIAESFESLKKALAENQIDLEIGFASEVRVSPEIMPWLSQNEIPFLGDYEDQKVILLEMPHSHVPAGIENMLRWLSNQGVIAMIAHPERNKDIMREPSRVIPLYNEGCLFQLTAGSVAGNFGESARQAAKYLLQNNYAHILASDAHNLKSRPPELEPGRKAAERYIGESASWDLVLTHPKSLTQMHFEPS
jgi:protein-tyrosine phosphatase